MFWKRPEGTLEKPSGIRYISSKVTTSGANPGVADPDRHPLPGASVHLFGSSGRRIRTDISSLVWAGVLPLDEPRELEADCKAAFP